MFMIYDFVEETCAGGDQPARATSQCIGGGSR